MSDPNDDQILGALYAAAAWLEEEMEVNSKVGNWPFLAVMEGAAEIERLRAGGCARDQRATQFCAEAVQAQAEARALSEAAAVLERKNDSLENLNSSLLWQVDKEREICESWRKRAEDHGRELERVRALVREAIELNERASMRAPGTVEWLEKARRDG